MPPSSYALTRAPHVRLLDMREGGRVRMPLVSKARSASRVPALSNSRTRDSYPLTVIVARFRSVTLRGFVFFVAAARCSGPIVSTSFRLRSARNRTAEPFSRLVFPMLWHFTAVPCDTIRAPTSSRSWHGMRSEATFVHYGLCVRFSPIGRLRRTPYLAARMGSPRDWRRPIRPLGDMTRSYHESGSSGLFFTCRLQRPLAGPEDYPPKRAWAAVSGLSARQRRILESKSVRTSLTAS